MEVDVGVEGVVGRMVLKELNPTLCNIFLLSVVDFVRLHMLHHIILSVEKISTVINFKKLSLFSSLSSVSLILVDSKYPYLLDFLPFRTRCQCKKQGCY